MRAGTRRCFLWMFLLLLVVQALPATAAAAASYKAKAKAAVYVKASTKSKVIGTLSKGSAVHVAAVSGKWAKVTASGKVGYVLKSKLTKVVKTASYKTLREGSSGAAVKRLQTRLYNKGYLKKSAVTGSYGSATVKAVRTFQLENVLTPNGVASVKTQKRIFSESARTCKPVVKMDWFKGSIGSLFPKRSCAVMVDVPTGTRIRIRRVGGSNHADVEPRAKSDTAKLKKVYGGTWSWDSRPVILIAGGKYIAAAINGMPHGDEISTTNGFDGQFCLHLTNSKTHGSDSEQEAHQANIKYAYNAFN